MSVVYDVRIQEKDLESIINNECFSSENIRKRKDKRDKNECWKMLFTLYYMHFF